jgi:hypothetical protein
VVIDVCRSRLVSDQVKRRFAIMMFAAWVGIGHAADANGPAAEPALNEEQRGAVGIQTGHPLRMQAPDRLDALGTILDASQLLADEGELRAARSAERYAAAELERLRGLYEGGAAASQKMLQAAEVDLIRARAQSQALAAQFAQRWGPLASMTPDELHAVTEAAQSGHGLLLRADVLGRNTLGRMPRKALLQVDGIQVPGRVLGGLRRSGEQQGTGLLIEVRHAPEGLASGARVPVALFTGTQSGFYLPRDAMLYDEHGAYVYRQLPRRAGEKVTRYSTVAVTPVLSFGEGWLVTGVDPEDDIVVRGAGVLWSLQDRAEHSADTDVD